MLQVKWVTNYLHYAIVLKVVRDTQIKLSTERSVYLHFTIISSFSLDLFNILSKVPPKISFNAKADAFQLIIFCQFVVLSWYDALYCYFNADRILCLIPLCLHLHKFMSIWQFKLFHNCSFSILHITLSLSFTNH